MFLLTMLVVLAVPVMGYWLRFRPMLFLLTMLIALAVPVFGYWFCFRSMLFLLAMLTALAVSAYGYWFCFRSVLWPMQRIVNILATTENRMKTMLDWLDDSAMWVFFKFSSVLPGDQELNWRHYKLVKHICWMIFLTLWILPMLFFTPLRALTIYGCSSATSREWLSGLCITPFLNGPSSHSLWLMDMWNEQETMDLDVRLPPRVLELVTGYHHVCNAEAYFHDQLLKIDMSPRSVINEGLYQEISNVHRIVEALCPQLTNFSDIICIEKDIQIKAFRVLVEAFVRIDKRSDRMDLSWEHRWLWTIGPTLRLLNTVPRAPYFFEPRLFDFQSNTEIHFQIEHFISELTYSMGRMDIAIAPARSQSLHFSLKAATAAVREFQQQLGKDTIAPEEFKSLQALGDQILAHLLTFREKLDAYETDAITMRRENTSLREKLKHTPRFEFRHTGKIQIPPSEIASLQNATFIDFQGNSTEKQAEPAGTIYHYDLDSMFTPNDLASLRQGVVQTCMKEKNVEIISGSLGLICIFWRHVTMISRYDHDPLSSVQRMWSYEQARSKRVHMEKHYEHYRKTGTVSV